MTSERKDVKFLAIDGDDVGVYLREYIIANDLDGASNFSQALLDYFDSLRRWLMSQQCRIVFCGGDSILALAQSAIIEKFATDLSFGPCTVSAGIGDTSEKAYLALQLAKARGKSQIVDISSVQADTIKQWNKDAVRATRISENVNALA